jgi:hypothetical protein
MQGLDTHMKLDRIIPSGENQAAPTLPQLMAGGTLSGMVDQTYLVTLRPPSQAIQQVFAATAEVRGNHLVFVDAKGSVAALFLRELVESWSVLPTKMPVNGAAGWSRVVHPGFGKSPPSVSSHRRFADRPSGD